MLVDEAVKQSCYWDYRLSDKTSNTFRCILYYFKEFELYKNDIGEYGLSTNILNGFEKDRPYKWQYWQVFWRLRKITDEVGLPYDVFWKDAFRIVRSYNAPYPIPSIFLNVIILDGIIKAGTERSQFHFAKHDFFSPKYYVDNQLQNEYYHAIYKRYESDIESLKKLIAGGKLSKQYFVNLKNRL